MTATTDAEEGTIDPSTLPPVPACLHCALRLTTAAHIYQHAPEVDVDGTPGKAVNMTQVMQGFAGALVDALFQFAPPEGRSELYSQFLDAVGQCALTETLSGTEAARRAGHAAH